MGKKLEEIEEIYLKLGKSRLENQDIVYLFSEVKRLREAIEKHIIEFDRLMKEMLSNRERGMKLAESVSDLQKALEEEK